MARFKIIVADDDVAMRRWLKLVLARVDADIREAGSGWEILALLAEDPVDLVISDLRMPMPNGLRTLAMSRCAGVTTPFLLVTAFGDDDTKSAAAALGAFALDKPVSAVDLLAHVRALLAPSPPKPAPP